MFNALVIITNWRAKMLYLYIVLGLILLSLCAVIHLLTELIAMIANIQLLLNVNAKEKLTIKDIFDATNEKQRARNWL